MIWPVGVVEFVGVRVTVVGLAEDNRDLFKMIRPVGVVEFVGVRVTVVGLITVWLLILIGAIAVSDSMTRKTSKIKIFLFIFFAVQ